MFQFLIHKYIIFVWPFSWILDEYMEMVGQPLMVGDNPGSQTVEFLRSLVATRDILEKNGQYFANTINSQHVIDLVENEVNKNDKKRNFNQMNFNGASRYSNQNQSYSRNIPNRRKSVW